MAHAEQDYIDGWQTYSTWIDDLRDNSDLITSYDDDPSFKQKILSCNTHFDRFKLIWQDDRLRKELEQIYKTDLLVCSRKRQRETGKSAQESKRLRELGNKFFKDGNFIEALDKYTQAVRYAPYPGQESKDDSLALSLANRSAALFALTRYRLCLLDIDLAIKYGYPEANKFKLLIRKVKCLHVLSVWANDVEGIKNDLRSMLRNPDTKEFVKTEINNMFEFLEQSHPEEMEKDELDVVDETVMKVSNASKSLAQAADCVEMSYDSEKGRYLLTNKDVSFGRLLVAEEPYVCNLAPSQRNKYCYHCFGRLYSGGIGCKKCTQVLFCSEECLEANSPIHAYECNRFLEFQDKLGVAYLVAHIIFKINFNPCSIPIYSKKTVDMKSLDDVLKIAISDWPDLVYKNDYAATLSLMDHSSDHDYDEIMGFALTATYLMIAFADQFSSSCAGLTDAQTQLVIGSVILRHLMQLQTNLISVLDQNLQGLVSGGHQSNEVQEHPIGIGIYPTISLLNHSCSPNILSIFHRNKFIARAAKSLECGTEINYCYGPSVNSMSKKDRQRRLHQQYYFNCTCNCCSENKENESRALLCPTCEGPVIYNMDLTNACLKCHSKNPVDVSKSLGLVGGYKSELEHLCDFSSNVDEKLIAIRKIERALSRLLYWRHPMFVQIKSELIQGAQEKGDTNLALKYCEEECELCSKTFGIDSYESIMAQLKLINVKWQNLYETIEETESPEVREKAVDELKALQTKISETRGKLKDLLASTNIIGAESSFETELKFLSDIQTSINRCQASLKRVQQEESIAESLTKVDGASQ